MQSEAIEQFHFPTPMMAAGSGASAGKVAGAALAVTNVSADVDLTTLPALPADWPVSSSNVAPNVLGHFIDLTAEGGDVYVVFGGTHASVSGGNVPAPATTNTVTSQAIASTAGVCMYIPAGTTRSFKLWLGKPTTDGTAYGGASPCRFMAYITKTGTATLRVHMSSTVR